ncbi:MAG: Phosphatidate cytidylyltransferase, partial [uncultured Rubrobacteraceae bacterium]
GRARRQVPPHNRRGGALDLRRRSVLRRAALRTPPALPRPEPEEDHRGRERGPAADGGGRRVLRLSLPGPESSRGGTRRCCGLGVEPGGRPLRVRPQAYPRPQGPRPCPARTRWTPGPDRQPALYRTRGVLLLHPLPPV